jgi:predicted enzyme related to lactoylglutathione lyase
VTAKVKKLGGTVAKEPGKVGDFATMSVVLDPHGAAIALWQPAKPEDAGKPELGHFVWNELSSKDPAASVKFYSQIGGFTSKTMEMAGMGAYHVLESGAESRAGIMGQMPGAPHTWTPYVSVASADQTADKAKRLGLTIVVSPTDIPNIGRFAILVDPQGVATGILQP